MRASSTARVAEALEGEDLAVAETVAAVGDRVVRLAEAGDEPGALQATRVYSRQVIAVPFSLPVDVTRALSFALEAVRRSLEPPAATAPQAPEDVRYLKLLPDAGL